ncbi:MAG: GNAT family N-acetyltransferase [Methylacidiphilales bacterium]|nr:GNAT family N-acetyltransferase [Candidatus Methylacidiphilales bacterium]NJR17640.1 GNAT family N-acetyltransferase [Calothrix sp. CSU_2_0]
MNQTSCMIRKAKLEDLLTIVKFNQSLAMEIRREKIKSETITSGIQAVLNDSKLGFYTVVEIEAKIIAIALITFEWSDWRNAWFWWLQDVYVEPSYRQQGVFRSLYMHLKQQAQLAQVAGLRLYVYKGNTKAQEVYQRVGMNLSNSLMFEDDFSN